MGRISDYHLWKQERQRLNDISKVGMTKVSAQEIIKSPDIGCWKGDDYTPSEFIYRIIREYGEPYNEVSVEQMIRTAEFSVRNLWFGMAGVTMGTHVLLLKSYVIHNQTVLYDNGGVNPVLPSLLYHEMVHVSQVLKDGKVGFLSRYAWQWIKSGFSYKNMCNIGYERQAYEAQFKMTNKIMTYGVSHLV